MTSTNLQHHRFEDVQLVSPEIDEPSPEEHICFLYDINLPPTTIEKIFGEPFHVKNKYSEHQITWRFVITLAAVYMVEGCIDWVMIAARYYGTAIWNIGPGEMQNFLSVVSLPWTTKLIYGLTIDSLALFGYKRKSYMLIFGILAPITVLICILDSRSYSIQLTFFTINALCVAFCDVIADALTVERTQFKSHTVAARLQSLAWASRYFASVAGLLISTRIETSGKPHDMLIVYWLYFFISLSLPMAALLLPERRQRKTFQRDNRMNPTELQMELQQMGNDVMSEETNVSDLSLGLADEDSSGYNRNPSYSIKQILALVLETICRKSIFYPVLFTFALRCTPTSSQAMDYFLIYKLDFSSVLIGYLSVAAGIAFLLSIGIITYQSRPTNKKFSLRKLYFIWDLIAAMLPFMSLILVFGLNRKIGLPDFMFMMSDTVIVAVAVDMISMAGNILYARICPPGIEGVFMTVLTSVSNVGLILSYQFSSLLMNVLGIHCIEDEVDKNKVDCNFGKLWLFIVIVNLSTLLPLVLIKKVPDEKGLHKIGEQLKDTESDDVPMDRNEMLRPYLFCVDKIVPFIKRCLCR